MKGSAVPGAPQQNRAALWSLVLGVASIPAIAAFGSGGLIGLFAVVLGGFGLRTARAGRGRGWMAIIGIVLGGIAMVVILGYIAALLTDDKPGLSS